MAVASGNIKEWKPHRAPIPIRARDVQERRSVNTSSSPTLATIPAPPDSPPQRIAPGQATDIEVFSDECPATPKCRSHAAESPEEQKRLGFGETPLRQMPAPSPQDIVEDRELRLTVAQVQLTFEHGIHGTQEVDKDVVTDRSGRSCLRNAHAAPSFAWQAAHMQMRGGSRCSRPSHHHASSVMCSVPPPHLQTSKPFAAKSPACPQARRSTFTASSAAARGGA